MHVERASKHAAPVPRLLDRIFELRLELLDLQLTGVARIRTLSLGRRIAAPDAQVVCRLRHTEVTRRRHNPLRRAQSRLRELPLDHGLEALPRPLNPPQLVVPIVSDATEVLHLPRGGVLILLSAFQRRQTTLALFGVIVDGWLPEARLLVRHNVLRYSDRLQLRLRDAIFAVSRLQRDLRLRRHLRGFRAFASRLSQLDPVASITFLDMLQSRQLVHLLKLYERILIEQIPRLLH